MRGAYHLHAFFYDDPQLIYTGCLQLASRLLLHLLPLILCSVTLHTSFSMTESSLTYLQMWQSVKSLFWPDNDSMFTGLEEGFLFPRFH